MWTAAKTFLHKLHCPYYKGTVLQHTRNSTPWYITSFCDLDRFYDRRYDTFGVALDSELVGGCLSNEPIDVLESGVLGKGHRALVVSASIKLPNTL